MTDWYYHDPGQGRVGPLTADELRNRYRERQVQRDTLAWHAGLREWQTLDRLSEELGLDAIVPDASLPPPLPPAPPPAAAAIPGDPGAIRMQPAPKRGMSGCAIAAIVLAVAAVPVLGILAAIAIPAYQDYVLRAKVSAAVAAAAPLRAAVDAAAANGGCPETGDAGIGAPERYADATVAGAAVGHVEDGRCAIELTLRGHPRLDGKHVWLVRPQQPGTGTGWTCSTDLADRYLPASCRAPSP